jgi:TonB family protein
MERSSIVSVGIWLVNYLANSTWQVPLLLLIAMVAARLVARLYSAAAVHWTWVSALLFATALPAVRVEVWPRLLWGRVAEVAGGQVQVMMMPGTAVTDGDLRLSFALMAVLLAIYGSIMLYFAGRIAWGVWKTRSLRRCASAVRLPEELRLRWEAMCQRLGVMRVELCESTAVVGPAMVGMQTVLLPAGFVGKVDAEDLSAALAHELAHVRRRDYVKNVAYGVLMLPVSFHPCAWLIKKRVGESRESVCDAMAAEVLASRRNYARSLLRLAMAIPEGLRGGATAAVGIFEGNDLERRVRTMMERRKQLVGVARVAAMVAVLAISGAAVVSMVGTHVTVQAGEAVAGQKGPIQVSSGVMAARSVSKVQPKYPDAAKKAKIQGVVVLGAIIGKDGAVESLNVASGPKELRQSALDAVRQWTYQPFLVNGDPVEVKTTITVTYSLRE